MAGSPDTRLIQYEFSPADPVWIIQGCGENIVVVEATVVRVIGVVTSSSPSPTPVVTYNVKLLSTTSTSTITVDEVDMFHTLEDATAEYTIRLAA